MPSGPERQLPTTPPPHPGREESARLGGGRVVLAYLALTCPAAVGAAAAGVPAAAALHLGAAGFAWVLFVRPPPLFARSAWAPLLPVLLMAALYAELPLLMEGMPGPVRYHDARIQAWESLLFGHQPSRAWAGSLAVPWLSELLHLAYLGFYALVVVPVGLLAARGERGAAERVGAAATLAFALCFAVMVAFPVQGPRYLWSPDGVPEGPVRALVLAVLAGGSSRGAALPSAHVAVSVAVALSVGTVHRRAGGLLAALAVGVGLGAVYGGFHYGVDVLSGALVGAAAVVLTGRRSRAGIRRGEATGPGFTSAPGSG